MDGFFVRLLILDDIKENQKNGSDGSVTHVNNTDSPDRISNPTIGRRHVASDDPTCPRCGVAVYAAEVCHTSGGSYHAHCLSCIACHRVLSTLTAVTAAGGDIYCSTCYKYRVMEATNHPLGSGKTTTILARTGDPDQCPRCLGKVFQAEQVLSANAVYHKACFRCAEVECGKALDSTSYCDSPQGMVFCNACYKKLFGPRGCGYGNSLIAAPGVEEEERPLSRTSTQGTRPGSSTPSQTSSSGPKCPACLCAVYAAERVYVGSRQWHKTCLACNTCSKLLDSTSLNDVGDGMTVFCNKCYKLSTRIRGNKIPSTESRHL